MFTLGLIAVIVATFLRLQIDGQLPLLRLLTDGFSARGLVNGHARNLISATLLTRDRFMCASITVSLLLTLGCYEVLAGHVRTVLLAVAAAAFGPVSVAAGLGVLEATGVTWAGTPMGTVDIGASAIIAAAAAAVAGIVRYRLLTLGLLVFVLGGLVVHHQLADWEHLSVFPFGYTVGRFAGVATTPRRSVTRPIVRLTAAAVLIAAGAPISARLLPAPAAWRPAAGSFNRFGGPAVRLSPPRLISTTFPTPALSSRRRGLLHDSVTGGHAA